MKQTIIFSEVENINSYRTAIAFSKLPDYAVYVLHKKNERQIEDKDIKVLEIEERRQNELKNALECIEEAEGSIDILVLSAGKHCEQDGRITDGHDYEALLDTVDENINGAVQVVRATLGLLRKGTGKRIVLLTEEDSSINLNKQKQDYGYLMSLAALNMLQKQLFNELRPEGFTFRCYAFGSGEKKGISPVDYIKMQLCYDKDDAYIHSEENRIVMRNGMLRELPW